MGPSPAHHNLYPLQARLIAGEPLRVVAERVAMQGHTLRGLVSRIDPNRFYYLLGEMEIADGKGLALAGRLDRVETYNPASLPARDFAAAQRPRSRTGAVAGSDRRPGRGGGAVLAQARRGGGDAGAGRNGRWSGSRRSCGGFWEGDCWLGDAPYPPSGR